MQAVLHTLVQDFFTQMGISFESLEFTCQDPEAHIYQATVHTPDSKILIGVHGQTLDHIKHLLSRMGEKKIGARCTIHVEVNDYLKAKDDRLYRYLDSKILEARTKGGTIILNELSSYERKKAHDYIKTTGGSEFNAHSEGEGAARRLHITYERNILADLSEDGIGI